MNKPMWSIPLADATTSAFFVFQRERFIGLLNFEMELPVDGMRILRWKCANDALWTFTSRGAAGSVTPTNRGEAAIVTDR